MTLMLRDAQPETRGENVKQQEMRGESRVNDEAEQLNLTKTLANETGVSNKGELSVC